MTTSFRSAIYTHRWLLLSALLIQVFVCLTQAGYLHPDQHFQLIEFSSRQLGEPSGAASVWELQSHIRPTLQVYVFSLFVETCRSIGLTDAYQQLTVLRLLMGLAGFVLFNAMSIHYFMANRRVLFSVLLLVNLSWLLPYTRTMFSSEMASSLAFFGAVFLYALKGNRLIGVLLTGVLFSLAFYFRFQMAFGLIGFGVWLLFVERQYKRLLPMAIGFGVGLAINTLLDYGFYHELVFTPYDYYRVNITEGKAAEFGTSGPLYYVVMLVLVTGAPPISFFLLYYVLRNSPTLYRQPLFFSVLFFIVGHSFVGHKEERFLFPIVNVLPMLVGWSLPLLTSYYQRSNRLIHGLIRGSLYGSVVLNGLALLVLLTVPIAQTTTFSHKLTTRFRQTDATLFCLTRSPFETESGLPLTFYRRNAPNLTLVKLGAFRR